MKKMSAILAVLIAAVMVMGMTASAEAKIMEFAKIQTGAAVMELMSKQTEDQAFGVKDAQFQIENIHNGGLYMMGEAVFDMSWWGLSMKK